MNLKSSASTMTTTKNAVFIEGRLLVEVFPDGGMSKFSDGGTAPPIPHPPIGKNL